jgi:hypothetical protein
MNMSRLIPSVALATVVAAGCSLSMSAPASATEIYSLPSDTVADQSWSGSLGLDFQVTSNIVVDGLGAFYDGGSPILVELFETNQANSSGTLLAQTTITTGSPVYTFNAVAPITLTPGYYQITASGYGTGSGDFNTGTCSGTCNSLGFNPVNGLIFGAPWYNDPGVLGFADGHEDNFNIPGGPQAPFHFYGAGNIEAFAATTPLPATWTMLIAGFIGLGFFAHRGSKKSAAAIAAA